MVDETGPQSEPSAGNTTPSHSSPCTPENYCIMTVEDSSGWVENDDEVPHDVINVVVVDQHPAVRHVPRLFRFSQAPPEATGLGLDIYARAVVIMSSLFVGPVLIQLATEEAESRCNAEDCEDARIYGMKPSSLLSNIAIFTGLFFFYATGDKLEQFLQHRLRLSRVFSGILFMIHICATFAYTSELTANPTEQTKYNAYFNVLLYISTLVFLVEVLSISYAFGLSDLGTARTSQIVTATTSGLFFGYAWLYLFRERPALSRVPEGSTLLRSGFRKILHTSSTIRSELPALKWFMVSVMFNEAATSTLITIATTYMADFLEMDSTEIGVVFLTVLLLGIPGTKLGELVALRYNPVISARICTIFFILATMVASLVLTGPQDKNLTAVFGVLWGICLGWLHPMDSTIFITVIPKGQESELMGMYIFCGQVLSWLPPLLFTVLNESGVEMSIGLASLNAFFLLGLCCLFLMGSYDNAVESARLKSREGYVVNTNASEIGAEADESMGDIVLASIS